MKESGRENIAMVQASSILGLHKNTHGNCTRAFLDVRNDRRRISDPAIWVIDETDQRLVAWMLLIESDGVKIG